MITPNLKKELMKQLLTCHCQSIEIELQLPNGFEKLRRCNCSICSRRNAVMGSVSAQNLTVLKGESFLKEYSFNTHTAKHFFCSNCGIYTHHQRRSNPKEFGFNMSCVDGVKIEEFAHISYLDGKDNHPSDK
tara:strand:+ start:21 stop:416 length:396 start_codon:yes stop_codon:yes gene_type:complete